MIQSIPFWSETRRLTACRWPNNPDYISWKLTKVAQFRTGLRRSMRLVNHRKLFEECRFTKPNPQVVFILVINV